MTEARRNLLVGLFMIAGLVVLGTLLVLFGERPSWLGGAEWELTIEFDEVEGVSEGMDITLSGVQVGRVGRVEFSEPARPYLGVVVVGLIRARYSIPEGATARVYAGPLGLGRGHIDIVSPPIETSPLPTEGASIDGEMGNLFEDLIPDTLLFSIEKSARQIGDLAAATTPLADDLHQLFEKRTVKEVDDPLAEAQSITATVYTVVERFDNTLRHVNDVLGDKDVKSKLRDGIENLHQMTEDGRTMMATLRETATQVQEDLDRIAARVDSGLADANAGINELRALLIPALDEMGKLAENLNRASRSLAQGEGTVGMLLHDARLYEAMLLSMQRITDAVDKIRRLVERWEKQGYSEHKIHEAVGPFDAKVKKPIAK
ncbi:MAG: MlaD family protein [Planctomycetota bacterium]